MPWAEKYVESARRFCSLRRNQLSSSFFLVERTNFKRNSKRKERREEMTMPFYSYKHEHTPTKSRSRRNKRHELPCCVRGCVYRTIDRDRPARATDARVSLVFFSHARIKNSTTANRADVTRNGRQQTISVRVAVSVLLSSYTFELKEQHCRTSDSLSPLQKKTVRSC